MKGKILKAYKREHAHSYASGAYATMELLKNNPGIVEAVYIHSKYTGKEDIGKLCRDNDVPVLYNDRAFERINQKENSYVLGVFCKYTCRLLPDRPHIVLVNPGDMGNLGTIIRTMAGMNIPDLAVIEPAADIFHPKTVRASMGSLFHIRSQCFQSFEAYRRHSPGMHVTRSHLTVKHYSTGITAHEYDCSPAFWQRGDRAARLLQIGRTGNQNMAVTACGFPEPGGGGRNRDVYVCMQK